MCAHCDDLTFSAFRPDCACAYRRERPPTVPRPDSRTAQRLCVAPLARRVARSTPPLEVITMMKPQKTKPSASTPIAPSDARIGAEELVRQQESRVDVGWVRMPRDRIRPIDAEHVIDLAESIAAIGIMQPPVVDRNGVLIAGAHRYCALLLLTAPTTEAAWSAWLALAPSVRLASARSFEARVQLLDRTKFAAGRIPVVVADTDVVVDPEHAVALEVAENEKRRDYSPGEVKAIADRLRAVGFRDHNGRPPLGERALRPALALILGKSTRAVRRLLSAAETRTPVLVSGENSLREVDRQVAAIKLQRAIKGFLLAADRQRQPDQNLAATLERLLVDVKGMTGKTPRRR